MSKANKYLDCRNARVRLRRRLEVKYPINRVSVRTKELKIQDSLSKEILEVKNIPRIMVNIDLNHKKDEFILDEFSNLKSECKNFVVKVDYFENEYCDYKISFLADNIDVGLERIKKYAVNEIINNVVSEVERLYKEIKIA